jgi:5-methylthioadenosine/S-adenosylhomocysteine deaminase
VAARLGVGIHLHVAESRQKVEQSLKLYDMTPVEVMNRNGVFDVPVLAAHCIYVTETDREILASRGVTAVFCPTYQMRRGVGHTPVAAFEASGVPVVLGTERPTVSGRLDVLQEMRLAALLRQSGGADAGSGMDQAALRMAARDSAHALGFGMSGVISPGRAADLVFIDRGSAHLPGGHLLTDLVLYSVLSSDVSDVMVAGKWLMRDRKLPTLDEEEIRREAGVRGQRLMADTKF